LTHLDGVTVTHNGCAIDIHTDKIPGHDIIVAPDEDQYLMCVKAAYEAEPPDRGTGTIASESASCGRTKPDHLIACGVTDHFDLDLCVIAGREHVRTCAWLRVAVDNHRLTEPKAKVARTTKTLSERDRANLAGGIAARIARRDVELNQVRRAHWRRVGVRRINRLPQGATCSTGRSVRIGG
jgi:hypothetical protein